MIIELLLGLIFNLFDALLIFEIPDLPAAVVDAFTQALSYMEAGAGIVAAYTDFSLIVTLFSISLTIEAAVLIYHFVMWVLRKIPVAGIN